MKMTIRGSVFETNSSSSHTFIYVSKRVFEAWKRGEKILSWRGGKSIKENWNGKFMEIVKDELHGENSGCVWGDASFVNSDGFEEDQGWWSGTYEGVTEYADAHFGECVPRLGAKEKYVDPEEWDMTDNIATFREALITIRKWDKLGNVEFTSLRETLDRFKDDEETIEKDVDELIDMLYLLDKREIEDEIFTAFREATEELENMSIVYQESYMDVEYDGDNVKVHIWGRLETDPPERKKKVEEEGRNETEQYMKLQNKDAEQGGKDNVRGLHKI
ncbi:MAG: hypothetical protein FWD81_02840 [Methanomassiliicoccaceae archaeon]|nr:hypothetical protein [Methanomassiliicoccaceae archaeon]